MNPPGWILVPTMAGARVLAVLTAPIGWAQGLAGSAADVSTRLRRWADLLPSSPPGQAWAIVLAVVLGVLVAPLLLVLGVAALVAVGGPRVARR